MDTTVFIIVLVLGLAFGSFINAWVWRLHKQSSAKNKVAAKQEYSITKGRSMCPNCGHRLAVLDLIPVLSWLLLRGRCRYCHKPISVTYPLVELLTAVLFVMSYIYWPLAFNHQGMFYFVIWLALLINVIALAVYDIRWMTLPNKVLYPLFGLVAVQILATIIFFDGRLHYILNDLLGLLIGGGVFFILFQLSAGKWIGGGDVKLGALLGLYLGLGSYAIMMIFFASVIGSLYSIPLLATGKIDRRAHIPYGPFLILAAIIIRLFGSSISSWLSTKGLSI
jgi:prepilin signal peptidase PulO-like enzyme (type II secretory pathway)